MDVRVSEQDRSDAQIDRARIDGGFSFALAAFLAGLGLLALLERIGLPDALLRLGVVALIFSGIAFITARSRSMRPVDFFAGGRRLPASYAGLAFAGTTLGLALPFFTAPDIGFASALAGFGAGLLWLVFAAGPYLRRSGLYSFADLMITRFPHVIVRGPLVLTIAFCAACVSFGGYEIAVHGLAATTGIDRSVGAAILGGLLIVFVVPAGLSSVLWVSLAAAVVTIAALVLPLGFDMVMGTPLVVPIFGDPKLWAKAAADFALLTGAKAQPGFELPLAIGFGLGLASLAPLLGPQIASRNEGSARRSGLIGLVWLAVIAMLMGATIAGASLALTKAVTGRSPAHLPPAVTAASGRGEIAICGVHTRDRAALTRACAAAIGPNTPLRARDIKTEGTDLLQSLPALRGSEPTLARLAGAFMIVLGMAVAAAGVQTVMTSLGHDILHPLRRKFGPVSQRLAVTRLMAVAFIGFAGLWLAHSGVDVRALFVLALMLSAALVMPLFILALLRRPNTASAFAAFCVSAFVMLHFSRTVQMPVSLAEFAREAVFACFDGVAVGLFIAFLPQRNLAARKASRGSARRDKPPPDQR